MELYIIFFRKGKRKIGDAFMGYHDDTCAAIILHVCQEKRCDDQAITFFIYLYSKNGMNTLFYFVVLLN
jgi:hypothetical protein